MVKVEVLTRHRTRRVNSTKVKGVARKCAARLLPEDSVISVAFLSDSEMTEINEGYTGRKGTTDVLSFPLGNSRHDGRWYGEVVISLDSAARQARERRVTLAEEVTRLIVHATVHLAGYDHHTQGRFKEMRKMEIDLLMKCLK